LDQPIPEKLATQVQRHAVQGKRILTFCSGSFLLAELGLLDNRSAMTHWRYADEFKQRYPKVNYIENELFTLDNELGCSAGSAAGIDLGLAVIAEDFGRAIANKVARRMVVSTQRQGGQTQFVQSPVPVVKNQFAASLDWALQNLNEGVDVNGLADKANMSRRSFDRKFRATFNVSPNVWLTEQRIARVKELLENETWSIDRISELAGFETATTMRFHFSKQVGIPPTAYRQQFGVR
jgi:AraC family transcriptional activator FtrA